MALRQVIVIMLFLLVAVALVAAPQTRRTKSFVFQEIEIKGKIQKPEAMYFLSRAKFVYRTLDLQVNFVPKVKEAVFSEDAF